MTTKKSHFRWVVVGLIFFITVINYIDRASIAFAIQSISSEFHLTQRNIGFILGAFGIGYTLTTFLGGIAADHYGAKRTLTIATIFWGLATGLTGLSPGFFMVFFSRILLGLSEGPNFPGATRAISDWLPEKERTRALSFALISVPISLAIGGPIVSQLVLHFTWRGAYYILSGLAFIWLPLWWLLFEDKPSHSMHVNADELTYIQDDNTIQPAIKSFDKPWKILLFNKTLLTNNWAFFVFGFYLFFFMTWLPSYLTHTFHFNLTQVGIYTMLPWFSAAGLMWIVSTLSDQLFKKTKNLRLSRSYPILLSQLLSGLCIIPIIFINNISITMLFLSLAIGFAMSANASFYAVNIDLAKERAGTALGLMDAIFALSGFIAPTLAGFIVTWTGHFEAVFYLLAGLALSSTILTYIFHNR